MFCLERDSEGRTHCHAIYFGLLTRTQRADLKKAGGKWSGKDKRKQLKVVERWGADNATGWVGWYMQKDIPADAVYYIPREMNAAGRAHFESVLDVLLPLFKAEQKAKRSQQYVKAVAYAQEGTSNAIGWVLTQDGMGDGQNDKESLQGAPIAFSAVGNLSNSHQEQGTFRNLPRILSAAMQPSSEYSGGPDCQEARREPGRAFGECDSQPEQSDQPAQEISSKQSPLDAKLDKLVRWADQLSWSQQDPQSNIAMLRSKINSMNVTL